jgi:acetyl-CoA acetyltransferase
MMREPITLDDHAASRYIAEPLRKLDCCLETDGALALVVTSAERARDARTRPVAVLAAVQATGREHVVMTNYHAPDFLRSPSADAGPELFEVAGVTPADIDCAQFYDAFTPLVVTSLEEFGFCKPGEGGPFTEGGRLAWPDGALPSNTSGGGLSEAYVHGFNLMVEGVRQMRGEAICQVRDARLCLVTSGAGVPTSAMILGRE